jgi:hypothetical protein
VDVASLWNIFESADFQVPTSLLFLMSPPPPPQEKYGFEKILLCKDQDAFTAFFYQPCY